MLDGLSRDLSKLIDEDLREIDEEGLLGSGVPGANLPPIRLVPEDVVLYMGEDKTISVMVVPELCASDVVVQCEPAGVVGTPRWSFRLTQPSQKTPRSPGWSNSPSTATRGHDRTHRQMRRSLSHSLVEVRSEREIIEVELQPVDHFQFERDNYRIAWTRKKTIRILAPLADIAEHGADVSVSSSDPGVVIRKSKVKFSLDEEVEHYVAEVTVEARTLSSQATLTARLGNLTTVCKVVVTKEEEGPSIKFDVVDEEAGDYRAAGNRKALSKSSK